MDTNPFRIQEQNPFRVASIQEVNPFRQTNSVSIQQGDEATQGTTFRGGISSDPDVPSVISTAPVMQSVPPSLIHNIRTAFEGITDTSISGITGVVGTAGGLVNGIVHSLHGMADPKSQDNFMQGFNEGYNSLTYTPDTQGGMYWQEQINKAFKLLTDRSDLEAEWMYDKTNSPALAALTKTIDEGTPQVLGLLLGMRAAKFPHESIKESVTKIGQEANSFKQQGQLGDMIQRTSRSGAEIIPEEMAPLVEKQMKTQQHFERIISGANNAEVSLPDKIMLPEQLIQAKEEANKITPIESGEITSYADTHLNDDFYKLQHRMTALDVFKNEYAKNIIEIVKKNPEIDLEKIYNWAEAHGKEHGSAIELNPKEKWFYDSMIKPLTDHLDWDTGYVHRLAEKRTPVFDRMKENLVSAYQRNILRRVVSSEKSRKHFLATDEAGNSRVVTLKGGKILGYDEQGNQFLLGNNRKLTEEKMYDREVRASQKAIKRLESDIKKHQFIANRMKEGAEGTQDMAGQASNDRITILSKIMDMQEKIEEHEANINRIKGLFDPSTFKDKVFIDKTGGKWKLGEATSLEIEQETGTKYHKNIAVSALEDFADKARSEMAEKFLDTIKHKLTNMTFEGADQPIAVKTKHAGEAPKGYRITTLPELRSYYMDPQIANVFDEINAKLGRDRVADPVKFINFLNREVLNTMFVLPYWHMFNETAFGIKNRGLSSWLNPKRYSTLAKTMLDAYKMIDPNNPQYMDLYTNKGMSLRYPQQLAAKSNSIYSEMLGYNYGNTDVVRNFKEGNIGTAALNAYRNTLTWSNNHLWKFSDFIHLRDYLEKQMWGWKDEDILKDIHNHFPTYELPMQYSTVNLVNKPYLTSFFPYKFDVMKDFVATSKEILNYQKPLMNMERGRAIDKMAMLGVMAFTIWPQLDKAVQQIMGNDKAYLIHFGPTAMPIALQKSYEEKSFTPLFKHLIFPALATIEIAQQFFDLDIYKRDRITQNDDSFWDSTLKRIKHAMLITPYLKDVGEHPDSKSIILSNFGLISPKPQKGKLEKQEEKMEKQMDNPFKKYDEKIKKIEQGTNL